MEEGNRLEKSPDYEKIEGLIRRGDFPTAETLVKKRTLSSAEWEALSALMEKRRKTQAAERNRARKKRRLHDRLEKFSWRSWKWFLGIFLLLGTVTFPYIVSTLENRYLPISIQRRSRWRARLCADYEV